MKWFKHNGSLRNDPKVKRLIREYGSDGYAVYVAIIESIADSLDPMTKIIPFLEEEVSDIAYEFKIDSERVRKILDFCIKQGLLEESTTGYIFCFKLYKYVDEYFTKPQKNKELYANRNKEIINAYKQGGLHPMLLCLKELAPQFTDQIGQIKIDTPYQLATNSGVTPNKLSQEEIRIEENRVDKNRIEEEKNTKKEYFDYSQKPKYPNYQPSTDKLSTAITKAIEHWNSKENLPSCKYSIFTLPDIANVKTKFDVFRDGEILKAIDNLDVCYDKIDPNYRPKAFHRFIINSLDNWLDEAEPCKMFESESTKEIGIINPEDIEGLF